MRMPILTATLRTDCPVRGVAALLRGFFSHRHPESVLLHQHVAHGDEHCFAYLYPRVQYRLHHGTPQLVGIADGTTVVVQATQGVEVLELAGWRYRVLGIDYQEGEVEIGEAETPQQYAFASPWLALSQKNYRRYQSAHARERLDLLKRILVGNILSMCKSLGMAVTERLHAFVDLRSSAIYAKKERFLGFVGAFSVNFHLVPALGLGHLVSVGFGEISRLCGRAQAGGRERGAE